MAHGNWSWTDGTPFDFTDFNKGEPQNISGSNCGALSLTDGYWSAQDCFKTKPFVCEVTTPPITAPSPTIPPFVNCTDGWIYFQPTHSCYGVGVYGLLTNWTTAENYCQNLNAHLPSVHSFEEFRLLETYLYIDWYSLWTGIFTVGSGRSWKTSDGSPAYFVAGLVLTDMRKRLNDENVKKLLFLNCNIKALNYDY